MNRFLTPYVSLNRQSTRPPSTSPSQSPITITPTSSPTITCHKIELQTTQTTWKLLREVNKNKNGFELVASSTSNAEDIQICLTEGEYRFMAVVLKDGHYSLTYMEDGSLITSPQERISFSIPYIPKSADSKQPPEPDHNKPDKKEEVKDKEKGKDKPIKNNRSISNTEPKKKREEKGERKRNKPYNRV